MTFEKMIKFSNGKGIEVDLPISEVGDKEEIVFLGSKLKRVVKNE